MVVHLCNLRTQETKSGRLQAWDQLQKELEDNQSYRVKESLPQSNKKQVNNSILLMTQKFKTQILTDSLFLVCSNLSLVEFCSNGY